MYNCLCGAHSVLMCLCVWYIGKKCKAFIGRFPAFCWLLFYPFRSILLFNVGKPLYPHGNFLAQAITMACHRIRRGVRSSVPKYLTCQVPFLGILLASGYAAFPPCRFQQKRCTYCANVPPPTLWADFGTCGHPALWADCFTLNAV